MHYNTSIGIKDVIANICLFLTVFMPDSIRVVRVACFLLWMLISLKRIRASNNDYLVLAVLLLANSISLVNGVLSGAPGAVRSMTVEFVWPLMFFVIFKSYSGYYEFIRIIKTLFYSYVCVVLFDIGYIVLAFLGINMSFSHLGKLLGCNINISGGWIQYTTTHMVSHFFMFPFCLMLLLVMNNEFVKKKTLLFILAIAFLCIMASGRVALQGVAIISIILSIFLNACYKGKLHITGKKILITLVIIAVAVLGAELVIKYSGIDISKIIDYAVYKFNSSKDASDVINGVRKLQADALIEGWTERPMIGHGTGSYTSKCIRDDVMVWAYEYTYHAMIFQRGLLGTMVWFGMVAYILLSILRGVKYKKIPKEIGLPFFIGLVSILIANYADPYLNKFGCMWMLYIPFSLASYADDMTVYKNDVMQAIINNGRDWRCK